MECRKWQVPGQQVPKWRHKLSDDGMTSVFHKNFRIRSSSQYPPCVKVSSKLHVPKWNDGAQVARWLIWQVPEWRHPPLYDVMTSDFDENHRNHFSYQYLACVKVSSWFHCQKWSYCCFSFLHRSWNMPKSWAPAEETPPAVFKVWDRWSWNVLRMHKIDRN